eukprot:jgi/Chrpa1/24536/Chrysochromulina_OHIO_Genome00006926-RA
MAELVQLELDEKDKENFAEMQAAMNEAQRELASLTMRGRTRHAEAKHAALTYAELEEVPDDARAFEQCGKMFLLRPVPELKESLAEAVESGNKDATALVEKTKHVEETYKKLQDDFNEFLKAHIVTGEKEEK